MSQYVYKWHARSKAGKTSGQKRKRTFQFSSIDNRNEALKYYKGPIRYGFLVSGVDPIYFNLIYRNPQWRFYNKKIRTIKTIFRIFDKQISNKVKYVKDPVSGKIVTMDDLYHDHSMYKTNCLSCEIPIEIHIPHKLSFLYIHCEKCRKSNEFKERRKDIVYQKKALLKLNEIRLDISEKTHTEFNEIKTYLDLNRKMISKHDKQNKK